MDNSLNFAAFIMTYQRNSTLEETINIILEQTFPPQKILIVDNDPSGGAKSVAEKLNHLPVDYHAVGYNSGPAGAAKIGLKILSEEGYEWIAWIDDDDPPEFNDCYEILIRLGEAHENCGCVGAVGQYFNKKKAVSQRVSDIELQKNGFLCVDNIAGGMSKIVRSGAVTRSNKYFDDKLFYGFEELDFDLSIKKMGWLLMVDRSLSLRHRIHYDRMGIKIKRGTKKRIEKLWREYYSTRNILYILEKNKYYQGLFLFFFRAVIKMFIGFRYGFNYGYKNMKFVGLGILHFIIRKKGKANFI